MHLTPEELTEYQRAMMPHLTVLIDEFIVEQKALGNVPTLEGFKAEIDKYIKYLNK